MDASHVYGRALALGCFYSHSSTRTFRRALTASLDSCAEIKSVPSVAQLNLEESGGRCRKGSSECGFGLVGKQSDLGLNLLRLSFLFTSCCLWTLSCDFVPHNYETLKWLSSLPTLMQRYSGRDSVAMGIYISIFPHIHTPYPLLPVCNKPYGFCGR